MLSLYKSIVLVALILAQGNSHLNHRCCLISHSTNLNSRNKSVADTNRIMYTSKALLVAAFAGFCLARAGHGRIGNDAVPSSHQQGHVVATSVDSHLQRRAEPDINYLHKLLETHQKLQLLRGMMDTDQDLATDNTGHFESRFEEMAKTLGYDCEWPDLFLIIRSSQRITLDRMEALLKDKCKGGPD